MRTVHEAILTPVGPYSLADSAPGLHDPTRGYHDGTLSGIYLALVVTAATVTTVSAARGTRAALAVSP